MYFIPSRSVELRTFTASATAGLRVFSSLLPSFSQKNLELKLPKWKSEHIDSHIFFRLFKLVFAYTGLNNAACKWHAVFYFIVCFKFIPIPIIEFQGIAIVALLSLFPCSLHQNFLIEFCMKFWYQRWT